MLGRARHQRQGARRILVITGIGERTTSSTLRRMTPHRLAEPVNPARIIAHSPAQKRHGGEGTLYVLPRRLRETHGAACEDGGSAGTEVAHGPDCEAHALDERARPAAFGAADGKGETASGGEQPAGFLEDAERLVGILERTVQSQLVATSSASGSIAAAGLPSGIVALSVGRGIAPRPAVRAPG